MSVRLTVQPRLVTSWRTSALTYQALDSQGVYHHDQEDACFPGFNLFAFNCISNFSSEPFHFYLDSFLNSYIFSFYFCFVSKFPIITGCNSTLLFFFFKAEVQIFGNILLSLTKFATKSYPISRS